MPTYVFDNPSGESRDFYFAAGRRVDSFVEDGVQWRYNAAATYRGVNTQSSAGYPHDLIWGSVNPAILPQVRKQFPHRTYKDDGSLMTSSMSETKRLLKESGLVDRSRHRTAKKGKLLK